MDNPIKTPVKVKKDGGGYEQAYCHQQGVYHCKKAGM